MPETIYITKDCNLSRDESTILVKPTEGKKLKFPVHNVGHLVMMGDGQISTKLMSLCGANGIRISIFDYYGWYKGSFEPVERQQSGIINVKQANLIQSPEGLEIAKSIIRTTVSNTVANLRYHQYRGKHTLAESIAFIEKQAEALHQARNREEIMGAEGIIKRTYYESWKLVDPRLDFGKRVKRPPNNPINCLISFLNALVYSAIRHEIMKSHLNETLSFLHAPSQARSSLSLDLSEPYKPLIADRIIWSSVRKGGMDDNWFDRPDENVCLLSDVGRKAVVSEFSKLLDGDEGFRKGMRETVMSLERKIHDPEEPLYLPRRRV